VLDYSVSETAHALGLSEANVKTTHHRARRAMEDYDRTRSVPTRSLQEQTREALERFLTCLSNHDVAGAEALLADDARHLSDGGGEFFAARVPLLGREKILRFYSKLTSQLSADFRSEFRMLNGLPAVITDLPPLGQGFAPRIVTRCDLDAEGRIKQIHAILATRKLTAVR
jgi:RNA polymerase sigma-70 factor (ECF subfamily)